jgi:hypothetical protein
MIFTTPRVLKGMFQVNVDYGSYRANPLALMLLGDGGAPVYTEGRSWSREGHSPTRHGAMFRIAMDVEKVALDDPAAGKR